jgi:Tfp pilus assembly protein PilF
LSQFIAWFTLLFFTALVNAQPSPVSSLYITKGAAAGYVKDQRCADCHLDKYNSYQEVGMSQSFKRPAAKHFIENFKAQPFYHQPSQRFYQISRQGDDLTFKRYQLDQQGNPINVFRRKIDYILGSGNKTRSYLYQTEVGEIYQLPLGWYSGSQSWQMAPGYEQAEHAGVTRNVRRECMFCHNAFPEVEKDSDWHWQPQFFPHQLPEGTGCQRCHGPGGEHVKTVLSGKATKEQIHASIVNPAKLDPQRRDSVCFQCHLLPSVAMVGARNFNRADYSFRPGELLSEYLVHVDVDDANVSKTQRFEINHHAYRLRQSECFVQSKGALSCINCHDPHVKVKPNERVKHYGQVCASCHQKPHKPLVKSKIADDDCNSCHMPQRRTQDVVHVTMTDHNIGIHPTDGSLVAPLTKQEPILQGIELLFDDPTMDPALAEVYKATALTRSLPMVNYVDHLENQLKQSPNRPKQAFFDLIKGQLALGRYVQAESLIQLVLGVYPQNFRLKQWLAKAYVGQNKLEAAAPLYLELLKTQPKVADIHYDHGLFLMRKGQEQAAYLEFVKTTSLKPVKVGGWYFQGVLLMMLNQPKKAVVAYRKALEVDPRLTLAYVEIVKAYRLLGNKAEARRFLAHGLKVASQPALIIEQLP